MNNQAIDHKIDTVVKKEASTIANYILGEIPGMVADSLNMSDRDLTYNELAEFENLVRTYLRQRI